MAGEGGAAVLQVLVQNLIDLSKKEISLIRGLEGEAQNLIQNLGTIQGFLNDAETKVIPNEAVKIWLQRLENAVFEADNVLDELHYHDLSKTLNIKKKEKVLKKKEKVLLTCFSPFIDYARNRKMAVSIQKINKDLDSINKTATELGLQKILADAPTALDAGVETDSFSDDPIFIGRDEAVSEIVKTLITSVTTHEKHVFSILPIVGMGGLGKTTLTRNVFHHQQMESQFESRIWVHVSQVFDPINLFNKILEGSKRQEKDKSRQQKDESRDTILAELKEALKDKTYLLVLDDVWNEDVLEWEGFLNSLSGVTTTKGNGIIVTTRSTEVASIVGTLPIHHLKGLSEEECWSIIRAKTFGNEDVVPSDVEFVGREMAKRCGGLPLAASVVGGVLRRDKSADEWRSIRQKWLSSQSEGDNNITQILKLSFNYLPSPSLKKCFAYCSIFPKGEYMVKQKLIEMWMGEGFLGSNEDMESVGDMIYNVLLHSSLLQVAKSEEYGQFRERCVMHDLVHDVASSVLGSSNKADGITRVRYQLIQQRQSSPITKEVAQHLRTLIFQADHQLSHDIIFSDFKCLHVLTLEDESLKEFPRSIRKLIHLRNLNISQTEIEKLPDWIGELHHLQTLGAGYMKKLPSTIKYLINLRHLHVASSTELPAEIGRLTSLQTLSPDFIVRDENGYKIEELGSLNNLKGTLRIECLEEVHDKEEAEKANLSKKSKLIKLSLKWTLFRDDVESIYDENVLEGLQPHSNLKTLEILGFRGKRFPDWTLKMAVRNEFLNQLVVIVFYSCTECEEIPMLGHLPNLKSLYLRDLRNVKSINSSFYGIGNETGVAFPALETLELSDMDSLKEWAEVESGSTTEVKVFPYLRSLKISNCNQLMKVPMLGHLPKLETLKLCDMDSLKEWAEVESGSTSEVKVFPNLQTLEISNCNQLMKVPMLGHLPNLKSLSFDGLRNVQSINSSFYGIGNETGVVFPVLETLKLCDMDSLKEWAEVESGSTTEVKVFPHLRYLKISNCNQLMKVPMLGHLPNLSILNIEKCPDLKRIGCSSGESFTSLAELRIRECHGLMDLPYEMVESSVLETMELTRLSSLSNLPRLIECLAKSAAGLRNLTIVGVPKFIATTVEVWHFPKLYSLDIDVRGSGETSVASVDRILRGCSCDSLRLLSLTGMDSWKCLPESIQHLTSLRWLELRNFGMEELPEWFDQYISSCTYPWFHLHLYGCKRLKCLPSTQAMQRLIKEEQVDIMGCPELQQQSDDGSE